MKALVLAAGLGARLLPHTRHLPKPLFRVGRDTLLDIQIRRLAAAGCESVLVNTHHLADKIEAHIAAADYPIPVATRFEPEILGTGGAIKNASDFWDERPFLVVNSDILTDIDPRSVYDFHRIHGGPATLAVCPDPRFDSVSLTREGKIVGFEKTDSRPKSRDLIHRTFTGIQVLNPTVLDFIPEGVCYSSIDAFRKMIARGLRLTAYVADGCKWHDLGTPERYRNAVVKRLAPRALGAAFSDYREEGFQEVPLAGDGSDRRWSRLITAAGSLILADHGLRGLEPSPQEVDAFIDIGRHLHRKGIPVPEIYWEDRFSGLVFLEDLGDEHLQTRVRGRRSDEMLSQYRPVIDGLIRFGIKGVEGFNPNWTWQSRSYDRSLILEKECRYFVEAFLVEFLGQRVRYRDFEADFQALAQGALQYGAPGLIHRDMQSRNIMVRDGRCFFIDFQGARFGPLQYDLASLLIDPYVDLPVSVQNQLLEDYMGGLSAYRFIDPDSFRQGYDFCALTRNLQILGAYGHLSRVRGKTSFETYIPSALAGLQNRLNRFQGAELDGLTRLVSTIDP
ncbi:MAG: sugar phosphate nucleotidyltransferase [Desulfococcaceae bacterium]